MLSSPVSAFFTFARFPELPSGEFKNLETRCHFKIFIDFFLNLKYFFYECDRAIRGRRSIPKCAKINYRISLTNLCIQIPNCTAHPNCSQP